MHVGRRQLVRWFVWVPVPSNRKHCCSSNPNIPSHYLAQFKSVTGRFPYCLNVCVPIFRTALDATCAPTWHGGGACWLLRWLQTAVRGSPGVCVVHKGNSGAAILQLLGLSTGRSPSPGPMADASYDITKKAEECEMIGCLMQWRSCSLQCSAVGIQAARLCMRGPNANSCGPVLLDEGCPACCERRWLLLMLLCSVLIAPMLNGQPRSSACSACDLAHLSVLAPHSFRSGLCRHSDTGGVWGGV